VLAGYIRLIMEEALINTSTNPSTNTYYIGLDVGSTTVKAVVLDHNQQLVFHRYCRHLADVRRLCAEMLHEVCQSFAEQELALAVTGSAGIAVAELLHLPFIQEVAAGLLAVEEFVSGADVVVELGGEDAKITYLTDGAEERMNGACAGGTSAFLNQVK
jgi:activator of 2-hydroxyglutaryl-CoA dehydratase